jgi:hypothetical protein
MQQSIKVPRLESSNVPDMPHNRETVSVDNSSMQQSTQVLKLGNTVINMPELPASSETVPMGDTAPATTVPELPPSMATDPVKASAAVQKAPRWGHLTDWQVHQLMGTTPYLLLRGAYNVLAKSLSEALITHLGSVDERVGRLLDRIVAAYCTKYGSSTAPYYTDPGEETEAATSPSAAAAAAGSGSCSAVELQSQNSRYQALSMESFHMVAAAFNAFRKDPDMYSWRPGPRHAAAVKLITNAFRSAFETAMGGTWGWSVDAQSCSEACYKPCSMSDSQVNQLLQECEVAGRLCPFTKEPEHLYHSGFRDVCHKALQLLERAAQHQHDATHGMPLLAQAMVPAVRKLVERKDQEEDERPMLHVPVVDLSHCLDEMRLRHTQLRTQGVPSTQ